MSGNNEWAVVHLKWDKDDLPLTELMLGVSVRPNANGRMLLRVRCPGMLPVEIPLSVPGSQNLTMVSLLPDIALTRTENKAAAMRPIEYGATPMAALSMPMVAEPMEFVPPTEPVAPVRNIRVRKQKVAGRKVPE